MVLPSAIGAVVDGVPTTSQTPLSGHFSPVRAVVPMGFFVFVVKTKLLAVLLVCSSCTCGSKSLVQWWERSTELDRACTARSVVYF